MNKKVYRYTLVAIAVLVLIGATLIWWNFRAGRVTDVPSVTSVPSETKEAPQDIPFPTSVPLASENVTKEAVVSETRPPAIPSVTPQSSKVEPVVSLARNLEIPWALDFLPDGSIIFTERPGRIRLIDAKEGLLAEPLLTIDEVAHRGEGGLLGIAVHPDFAKNGLVYVYHTYQGQTGLANRVVRLRLKGRQLLYNQVILDGIPAASIHDGGRLKFGPDGYLYITAGDAAQPNLAQDESSLAGKILRLKDDGSIPSDNPFPGSPVYSLGHRNPQGLVWDSQGRLWATEHGSSARDELNLIEAGKNYGWPVIRGDETASGMERPMLHSGDDTWAPSGLAFLNGSLYFVGLRGQTLYQADIQGEKVELKQLLVRKFGRLRDVVLGPDKFLYLLTSNRDGRAVPTADDDLLIRVDPAQLAR